MSEYLDIIADRKLTYNEVQQALIRILPIESEFILIGEMTSVWNSYENETIVCGYEHTQGDFQTIIEVEFLDSTFSKSFFSNIIATVIQFCQELQCTALAKDPNLPNLLDNNLGWQFIDTYLLIKEDGAFKYVQVDSDLLNNNKIFKIIK